MTRSYVFGPVASRRLGRSLGIDLTRHKTCSLDCVYCEAGSTTDLTNHPAELVPVDEVIAQLDAVLATKPELDYVTFSGSGEPTLNSRIGDVVQFVKTKYPQYRLCLLTNAVRLNDPELTQAIAGVDLVIPSLDASCDEEFQRINRPAAGVTFDGLMQGLIDFSTRYSVRMWLELFIVPGVNDSDAAIARFVDWIRQIRPELVQLNTLDRPGPVDWVKPAPKETIQRFIRAIEPVVPVEAVGRFRYRTHTGGQLEGHEAEASARILNLASRRPATAPDFSTALDVPVAEVEILLEKMVKAGLLQSERQERGVFFCVPEAVKL